MRRRADYRACELIDTGPGPAAVAVAGAVASALGADISGMSVDDAARAAITQVRQLSQEIVMPQSLSEVGLKRESLQNMAKNAMLDHCYKVNPRPCTEEDMLRLYEIAF